MSETDWEARYQSGDMPWEKGEPSPGLVDFLAAHRTAAFGVPALAGFAASTTLGDPPKGGTPSAQLLHGAVLVPGCGTGHDARAWAGAGFDVVGMDLSPSAIRIAEERTRAAGLNAQFRLGNFLETEPFTQFDWIFEHTLFCAIDLTRRDDYVQAVLRWLKPRGEFLAVQYMIRDADGPPFGCTQQELMERFSPHFELKQGWVPRSYPNRAGLELMLWWQRK